MTRFFPVSFLSAVLIASAATPANADSLIVAGHRVGPIRIGMTATELYKAMGNPTSTVETNSRLTFYNYGGENVLTAQCWDGRVKTIGVRSSEYKTAQGLRVGDSQLALLAKMGQPASRNPGPRRTDGKGFFMYCYRGIVFNVEGGIITGVSVDPNSGR